MHRAVHLPTVDSTCAEARRLLAQPEYCQQLAAGHAIVVSADAQTAGIGRDGRVWSSPAGGHWMTIAWPLPRPLAELQCLPLVVGIAVAQVLEDRLGLLPEIKWPNDLLVGGRKLCGILCLRETALHVDAVLIGIGLNGDFPASAIGPGTRYAPTTLQDLCGPGIDAASLRDAVVQQVLRLLTQFTTTGFAPFASQLRNRLAWRGEHVTLQTGGPPLLGLLQDVDEQGRLLILDHDQLRTCVSGEVSRLTLS